METTVPAEKLMMCFCDGCNEIFAIPSRRGRPPKFCANCTNAIRTDDPAAPPTLDERMQVEKERKARERVDNLEWMLRLRGTHISQHRKDWE